MAKVGAEQFQRICAMMLSGELSASTVAKLIKRHAKQDTGPEISEKERWVKSFERDYIVSILKKNGGDKKKTAQELEIDLKYLNKLMRKHNIS